MIKKMFLVIAMFLLVVIPVSALSFDVVRFSGNNGGNGFIKSNDDLNLEVDAEISGDTQISIEQIVFNDGNKRPLAGSCSRISGNLFNCTSIIKDVDAGEYRVDLFSDDNKHNFLTASPEDSKIFNLTVDDISPELTYLNVTPRFSKDGKVKILFNAKDYLRFISQGGVVVGDTSVCSGVKSVDFVVDGVSVSSKKYSGICDTGLDSFDFQFSGSVDFKEVKVEAKVADFTGHSTIPKTAYFYVDNKKPFFQGFKILDRNGFELTHLRSNDQRNASIILSILGDDVLGVSDVDVSSVIVDLSKLNPAFSRQSVVKVDEKSYSSDFVIVNPQDCEVSVEVKDVVGNDLREAQKCNLPVDNKKPLIKFIKSLKQNAKGDFVLGSNSSIIVELEDFDDANNSGIGFMGRNVFLNLGQLGLSSRAKADSCSKNNAVWECVWNVSPKSEGKKTVSVDPSSSDDLGNVVENKASLQFLVDKKSPVVHNHFFSVAHEAGRAGLGGLVVSGDEISYSLNVSDVDRAFANFSSIGGDLVKGACYQNNTDSFCDFSSDVFATGPYTANISFELFDLADNKVSYSAGLLVYGLENDPNPDFWKSSISCTPDFVSTSLAKVQNFPVFCHVKLSPIVQGSSLDTASIRGDCPSTTARYVNDAKLINAHSGSKDPYFLITLYRRDFWNNSISFDCELDITSKRSGKITGIEKEKVTVDINFKDVKDPYTVSKEETDKAIKKADDFMDWLDGVNKVVRDSEELCSLKQTFSNVIGVLYWIDLKLKIFSDGLKSIPVVGTGPAVAVETMRQTSCYTTEATRETYEGAFSYLDQYCMFMNCQAYGGKDSWGDGTLNKALKYGGGGAPWCSNIEDYLSKLDLFGGGSGNALAFAQGYKKKIGDPNPNIQALNVKDSLIWSTACFCLPGIVKNLNEFREVKCRYATCLMNDVKELGITKSDCDSEKSYFECAHLYGEIWNLIPFSQFYDQIAQALGDLISNPVRIVDTFIGSYCVTACPDQGMAYYACAGEKVVATISEAVSSFNEIKKRDSWLGSPGPQNFCEEFNDAKRAYKK